jgi:hypothetical protein
MSVYGCTPYPNVEDYEGRTRLSPPAAYPSTVGYKATKVTSSIDTTSTLLVTTLAVVRNFHLYQESYY